MSFYKQTQIFKLAGRYNNYTLGTIFSKDLCKILKLIESNMRSDENCQISAPFELCKMKFNSITSFHHIYLIDFRPTETEGKL